MELMAPCLSMLPLSLSLKEKKKMVKIGVPNLTNTQAEHDLSVWITLAVLSGKVAV